MANSNDGPDKMPVDPLFKLSIRRRHYRRRADELEHTGSDTSIDKREGDTPDAEVLRDDHDAAGGEVDVRHAMAEILRLRRQGRSRRSGIEFMNNLHHGADDRGLSATSGMAPEGSETTEEIAAIVNRFAPQTGQVADVNKHMMAYIDTELAKLRQGTSELALSNSGTTFAEDEAMLRTTEHGYLNRQPATLGKLHEIDLGPDAKLRNIAKTEAAKRRIETGDDGDVAEGTLKPRLGKNGKPWRGRKPRTSDDLKRDKLVEEVLRESKLELYDEQVQETNPEDVQAADDRIAEQFRRDFLDAISSRHRRRGPSNKTAASKGVKKDDRPKGPKLGGSRSARAAMREQQEKAAKR